jgi:hypothetical protein
MHGDWQSTTIETLRVANALVSGWIRRWSGRVNDERSCNASMATARLLTTSGGASYYEGGVVWLETLVTRSRKQRPL